MAGQHKSKNRDSREEILSAWRDRLADPYLLDRAIVYNKADFELSLIPEFKRSWLTGRKTIDWSSKDRWKPVTKAYRVVVPVGGSRHAGVKESVDEKVLAFLLKEMSRRPVDFPNLRQLPECNGTRVDLWWGEDVTNMWAADKTDEEHRSLGRIFGYREDRIIELYPLKRAVERH